MDLKSTNRSEAQAARARRAWLALPLAVLPCAATSAGQEDAPAPPPPQSAGEDGEASDETTIVSARKWDEPLAELPQSATVLPGVLIRDAHVRDVSDAAELVPNVLVPEFSSRRLSFPFVRGIGSGQGEPAVTTYVDGVPQLTTGSSNLPLVDVERVEFLRGPQGTLYGRNALGGVIHLYTEPPSAAGELSAWAGFGNYDLREVGASVEGPLGETGAFGLSAQYREREGYTENLFTGNDVDDRESYFGRGQVLLTPDERTEVRFGMHGERARDGGFVLSDLAGLRASPHEIFQDFEGVAERDLFSPWLHWRHRGEELDFSSITAYVDWDVLETSDFDFSPADIVRRRTEEEQAYWSQELRISSAEERPVELGEDARLRWLVGLYGFSADSDRSAANDFRSDAPLVGLTPGLDHSRGDFDDQGVALFGQASLTLLEDFDLTGGLRWDYESKEAELRRSFETGGFVVADERRSEDESYDELLPSLSAAWRFREDWTAYVLAAKAFKAGGFNLDAPEGEIAFDTETSWSYEAGVRASFLEEKVHASAAVFHIDWEDMQLSLFDPQSGGYVDNAGESHSQGVELELGARPLEGLTLLAGFGLIDSEFDEFVDNFGQDVEGQSLAFAPETTWSLAARYEAELRQGLLWYLFAGWVDVGTFYYDAGNRASESFELLNLATGLVAGKWRFELWGRNVLDEEYVPIAFQANPQDPDRFVGESGEPRIYGFTARFTF